jgi:preprotein translocase subunit SecB
VQLSPLQLLEYVFDGVSVQPVKGYQPDPDVSPSLVFFPGKLSLSAEVGIDLLAEEPSYSDYGVSLALKVGPKADEQAPYEVHVTVKGLVRMHLTQAEGQAEERRVRALVNGVSLLYGAVRDQVITITSRSVHGPFLLPAVSFADLALPKPSLKTQKPVAKRTQKVLKATN